jgi:hypothetical protein
MGANTSQAIVTETSIVVVERNDANLVRRTVLTESRPATFAAADTALAFHSLARTAPWELSAAGAVAAPVAMIDNRFNGVVAARLEDAVGTTHEPFALVSVQSIENGDLISDAELSALYVVAASSFESGAMRVSMVGEGQSWDDRYVSRFEGVAMVARKI